METSNNINIIPTISVIMPVYNVELYIDEAIKSILNQTYKNFELIIIDDGSTDKTWEKIGSYNDKRIIPIQNLINLGNYPSRNIGMKMARGKYVAVMDGDDIAMPERLKMQFELMENDTELIVTGTNFRYSSNHRESKMPTTHEDIQVSLLQYFNFLHSSIMVRTEAIYDLNGYDEKYKYASDYNLLCQLSLLGKAYFLSETLMIYRIHPEQISKLHTSEQNKYANEVRKNFHLEFINKYKAENQKEATLREVGLPELGRIISLYTYARHLNSNQYKETADNIIDVLYKVITTNLPVDKYEGLCGVGYGFLYLLRNNFIEGDEDEVLKDIDNIIIKSLENDEVVDKQILLQYLRDRILPIHEYENSH